MRALRETLEEIDAMSDDLTPHGIDMEAAEEEDFRTHDGNEDDEIFSRALERAHLLCEEEEE